MVSPITKDEIFSKLQGDIENTKCFDCGESRVEFASISHGTLICSRCSDLHRQLGPHISFVRSLEDSWSIRQLKVVTAGGNSALKNFFEIYNMPSTASIDFKYKTVAAKYYREMLKIKVEGESCTMPTPSLDEALNLIEEEKTPERPESGGLFASAFNFTKQIGESVVNTASGITETRAFKAVEEATSTVKGTLKKGAEMGMETLEWGAEKARESVEKGIEGGTGVVNWGYNQGETLVSSTREMGEKGVNYFKSSAKNVFDDVTTSAMTTYERVHTNEHLRGIRDQTMGMLYSLEETAKKSANTAYGYIRSSVGGEENKEEEEEKLEEIHPQREDTPSN